MRVVSAFVMNVLCRPREEEVGKEEGSARSPRNQGEGRREEIESSPVGDLMKLARDSFGQEVKVLEESE